MYFKPEDKSLNGMFTYIFKSYNSNLNSFLSFASSPILAGRASEQTLFDPNNNGNSVANNFHTINKENTFVQVSFMNIEVILSHYTLLSRNENCSPNPSHTT